MAESTMGGPRSPLAFGARPTSTTTTPMTERLVANVQDLPLVGRLLSVRVYEVVDAGGGVTGYRLAAVDDVESDYALFVSRVKAEQLHRLEAGAAAAGVAAAVARGDHDDDAALARPQPPPPSAEAVANSIVAHLDIIGNRHRDIGRLVCREPETRLGKQERVTASSRAGTGGKPPRNAHLPAKQPDMRAKRTRRSTLKVQLALAALGSHTTASKTTTTTTTTTTTEPTLDVGGGGGGEGSEDDERLLVGSRSGLMMMHVDFAPDEELMLAHSGLRKNRKDSEASLLHRMANASATTVWRAELEGIEDETSEYLDLLEGTDKHEAIRGNGGEHGSGPTAASRSRPAAIHPLPLGNAPTTTRRALPERKAKHKELQQRRDLGRQQRLQLPAPAVRQAPVSSSGSAESTSPGDRPARRATAVKGPASPSTGPADGGTAPSTSLSSSPQSVPASAAIGNAMALKTFLVATPPEQEQFLRKKTIKTNEKRVFKVEGVFDETLEVEITNVRPGARRDSKEPKFAIARPNARASQRRLQGVPMPGPSSSSGNSTKSLGTSASEPTLATPRQAVDVAKVSPRPEELSTEAASVEDDGDVLERSRKLSQGASTEQKEESQTRAHHSGGDNNMPPLPRVAFDATQEHVSIPEDPSHVQERIHATDEESVLHQAQLNRDNTEREKRQQAETVDHEALLPSPRRSPPVIEINEEGEAIDHINDSNDSEHVDVNPEAPTTTVAEEGSVAEHAAQAPQPSGRVECWEVPDSTPLASLYSRPPHQSQVSAHQEKSDHDPDVYTLEEPSHESAEDQHAVAADGVPDASLASNDTTPSTDSVQPMSGPAAPADRGPMQLQSTKLGPDRSPHDKKRTSAVKVDGGPVVGHLISPSRRSELNRGSSFIDIHASAIAAVAAAAAAAASVNTAFDEHEHDSPKAMDAKKKAAKRRSHDASSQMAGAAGHTKTTSFRDGRRKTTHMSAVPSAPVIMESETLSDTSDDAPVSADLSSTIEDPSSGPPHSDKNDPSPVQTDPTPAHGSVESMPLSENARPAASQSEAEADRHQSKQTKRRTHHQTRQLHHSPTYHTKWHKWKNGRHLIEKVGCLQLEELVLEDPHNEANLVKLGLRYARWPGTSLAAIMLLEHASLLHEGAARSHEYWNSLGNAHFDVFLRNRKFLPIASFHLARCMQSFTRAFAYMASLADPLLLLRYAICLFWKKGENHLDKADDVFRELFTKFSSFCDKDRLNLLFLQFQILFRLHMYHEGIECIKKIMALEEERSKSGEHDETDDDNGPTPLGSINAGSDDPGHIPAPYDTSDYLLMIVHSQQASGDYMQASASFSSMLKAKGVHQEGSLSDDEYLQLWSQLADKTFHHEDYALALEYYAQAMTFAKESHVLARILYHRGLCYQALGEDQKCKAEYKRAKNVNRHVVPFATLTDLNHRYEDQFADLLHTPIAQVIEDVRQNLYDKAVTTLQRIFRRKKKNAGDAQRSGASSDDLHTSRPMRRSLSTRRSTNLLLPNARQASSGKLDEDGESSDSELEGPKAVDPHEAFLGRQAIALDKLAAMRNSAQQTLSRVANTTPAGGNDSPRGTLAASLQPIKMAPQSGLLSPIHNRPDLRRKHSMDSFYRLGYVPTTVHCVEYWEELLVTALDLFETRTNLYRSITRIRSACPLVTEGIAFAALAESAGAVDQAIERLCDTNYERELTYVTGVIDVSKMIERYFNGEAPLVLPALHGSPEKGKSPQPRKSRSASLPATRMTDIRLPQVMSPTATKTAKGPVRLSNLIEAHFASKPQVSGTSRVQDADRFTLMRDFRETNASLIGGNRGFQA